MPHRGPATAAVAGALLIWVASVPAATPIPSTPEDPERPEHTVALKGCIRGGHLTKVQGDPSPEDTYRLTGSRELVRLVQSHHEGDYLEVTGRLKGLRDKRSTMRKTKKTGKVTLFMGGERRKSDRRRGQQLDDEHALPAIELEAFRVLGSSCP